MHTTQQTQDGQFRASVPLVHLIQGLQPHETPSLHRDQGSGTGEVGDEGRTTQAAIRNATQGFVEELAPDQYILG